MKKLIIADNDEKYIKALAEYISLKMINRYEINIFSDIKILLKGLNDYQVSILLVGELFYKEMMEMDKDNTYSKYNKPNHTLILLEDLDASSIDETQILSTDEKVISKYISAEEIIFEIISSEDNLNKSLGFFQGFIGIYDLYNRQANMDLGIVLGQILSEREPTLYVEMMEFSGIKYLLEEDGIGNLSDLYYEYHQQKKDLLSLSRKCILKLNTLDYIRPPSYVQDIRDIDASEWMEMLSELSQKRGYENTIIHIGSMIDNFMKVMDMCKEIYIIAPTNICERAVVKEFIEYLLARGREDILEKLVTVNMPIYSEFSGRKMYEEADKSTL